jgi:hypothetical protein
VVFQLLLPAQLSEGDDNHKQDNYKDCHRGEPMTDKRKSKPPKSLLCPSAAPEMDGSVIFGIVVGTPEQPELVHLPQTKEIPPELLTLEFPVQPTEIFRIAAKEAVTILMVANVA